MNYSFNFNPFDNGQLENCQITVQLGTTIIQNATLPLMMTQMQFGELVKQVMKDNRPLKVTCIRQETTEDGRVLNNSLTFENNAFIEAFGKKREE
jgi:hypothetical protein